MAAAKGKDMPRSTIFNKLKKKFRVKEGVQATFASSHANNTNPQPSVERQTTTVKFLIGRSLIDHNPTIVKREPAH